MGTVGTFFGAALDGCAELAPECGNLRGKYGFRGNAAGKRAHDLPCGLVSARPRSSGPPGTGSRCWRGLPDIRRWVAESSREGVRLMASPCGLL